MVKILDIKISAPRLILRILTALILGGLSAAVLYTAPQWFIADYLSVADAQMREIIIQLVNTAMPIIGLLLSGVVFLTMMLRKTKAEGPLLIVLGLTFAIYILVFFNMGTWRISTNLSQLNFSVATWPMNANLNVSIDMTILMLASMLTPILIILKGYLLTRARILKTNSNVSHARARR